MEVLTETILSYTQYRNHKQKRQKKGGFINAKMLDQQTVPQEGKKWHTQWEKTVQIIVIRDLFLVYRPNRNVSHSVFKVGKRSE